MQMLGHLEFAFRTFGFCLSPSEYGWLSTAGVNSNDCIFPVFTYSHFHKEWQLHHFVAN
jgi:hypothetical protein